MILRLAQYFLAFSKILLALPVNFDNLRDPIVFTVKRENEHPNQPTMPPLFNHARNEPILIDASSFNQLFKQYEITKSELKPFKYQFNAMPDSPRTIILPARNFIQNIAQSVVQTHKMNENGDIGIRRKLLSPEDDPSLFSKNYISTPKPIRDRVCCLENGKIVKKIDDSPLPSSMTQPNPFHQQINQNQLADLVQKKPIQQPSERQNQRQNQQFPPEFSIPVQNFGESSQKLDQLKWPEKLQKINQLSDNQPINPTSNPAMISQKTTTTLLPMNLKMNIIPDENLQATGKKIGLNSAYPGLLPQKANFEKTSTLESAQINPGANIISQSGLLEAQSTTEGSDSSKGITEISIEYRKMWTALANHWHQLKQAIYSAGLDKDVAVIWDKFHTAVQPFMSDFASSFAKALKSAARKYYRKLNQNEATHDAINHMKQILTEERKN
ncbi:unnamed protein product, partial [Mesorhabditis belari]|uniref:Uncharacterized protein n=1 Tax=Mesorhabditis belari TaxID=2138241 RepID=A0AAF3F8V6_9BILA